MKKLNIYLAIILFGLFPVCLEAQQTIPNITDPRLDFTTTTLKGDPVQLSSMKGRVFLLDFWASWCGPCRHANKNLVKLYSKYKDKGFEIYGVSLDDFKNDWKKAVAKDKIKWMQSIDAKGFDANAAIKWNINAIPASFLVDKEGNVIIVDPDIKELEIKIKELLGL